MSTIETGQHGGRKTFTQFFDSALEFDGEMGSKTELVYDEFFLNPDNEDAKSNARRALSKSRWYGLGCVKNEDEFIHTGLNILQSGSTKTKVIAAIQNGATATNTLKAMTFNAQVPVFSNRSGKPVMSRIITGNPEPFIRMKAIDVQGKEVIFIAIDLSTLYDLSPETISDRATIIASRIVELMLSGYAVRVILCTNTMLDSINTIASLGICIKREDEPLNYSTLALMIEPSFNRIFSFSWRSSTPEFKGISDIGSSLYARYNAAQRRDYYTEVYGENTIVFCLGAMCEEMDHEEAERYSHEILENADASFVDGSQRQFMSYDGMFDEDGNLTPEGQLLMKAQQAGQVIGASVTRNILAAAADPDDWTDDEDNDPDDPANKGFKIVG